MARPQRPNYASAVLFLFGFGLFVFTRRSELVPTLPLAIILAPVFIIRFSRTQPLLRATLLTILGFVVSIAVSLWGLFELGDDALEMVFNGARSILIALMYAAPVAIDRAIAHRLEHRLLATFTYPVAATTVLFLVSLEGPLDGTVAKTIYGSGPLEVLQLYSVTGLWGFVFLWSWLASVANYVWENHFSQKATLKAAVSFGVVLAAVYAYGLMRTSEPHSETVRVASAVILPEDGHAVSMETVFAEKRISPYGKTLERIARLVEDAARESAVLVVFQEFAIIVREEQVAELRLDLAAIAAKNGVWVGVTYAWFANEGKGANMLLLADNEGNVQAEYQKRFLFGFDAVGEAGVFSKGEEKIPVHNAPFGRIALSICRDMSFPGYARQAGQQDADLLLTPSYDFPKSTSPSDFARAIESGNSMIRPTYNGISYIADPYGRIVSELDSDNASDGVLLADVPRHGIATIYASVGDLFAWANVIALFLLVWLARRASDAH